MVENKDFFIAYIWRHILHEYNYPNSGKTYSFKTFLLYLLEADTWGDDLMITICTMMWRLRASVIFPKTLKNFQLRHDVADLKKVDLLLIYGGGSHYSAVGTYPGWCHSFSGRYHGIRVSVVVSWVGETE